MIGQTTGHYRVTAELGHGGMGMVFRARDTRLDRDVALKFLPPYLSSDSEAKTRFIHEAKAASGLDHPNICTIYDIDETKDGRLFIAMAYYEGRTLKDRLEDGPLPADEAIEIIRQVTNALRRAHDAGIVHRDIKPANIMVTHDGLVKLLDFGIAKLVGATVLTREGSTIGTIHYMSPEQARGEMVDARSDIWSVGAVLYEMLVGKRAFGGEYDQAVVYSILNTEPEPIRDIESGLPAAVEWVVEKCLEKSLQKRYQSVDELLADLDSAANDASGTRTARRPVKLRIGRRQKRFLVRIASAAAVVLMGIAVYAWRAGTTEAMPLSLAVLPLGSDSMDEESEWFSNGMTDALITELAHIENVSVIARRSVMRYKDSDKSMSQIGEELNVTYLVDGTVSRDGESVTISARLAEAGNDQVVWGNRFETSMANILDTQSRIAGALAREIRGESSPGVEARISRGRRINPKVYEAYLRGMHNVKKLTPEDKLKGLEYLHEAVDLDPADPIAWTGLAEGYFTIAHSPAATPDALVRSRAAAEQAVALDSTLAEARSALAVVKMYYDFDWETAEKELPRVNELNPNLPMNHYHYSWFLVLMGRYEEALQEHRLAEQLDPLNPPIVAWTAEVLRIMGRYDEAERHVQKAIDLGDRSGIAQRVLGMIYLSQGKMDQAVKTHEEMVAIRSRWKPVLGATYAMAGRREDALRIAAEYESRTPEPFAAGQLIKLYVALGNKDRAFELAFLDPHHAWLAWAVAPSGPLYDFRDDPRFGELLDRFNLTEYLG